MRSLINPKVDDIPQLKKIWCEGFPDDAEGYCDFYFERYFRPDRCLAVYNGTEIESAVHWFDAYYKGDGGDRYGFLFPYAGATLQKYRGHRNLQNMIGGCRQLTVNRGKSGMIFAAAEELVHLYDHWGYKRIAKLHTYSLNTVPKDNGIFWKVCPFVKFKILRTNYLDELGNCFYWEREAERYMYDDIFTKGHILICEYDSSEYYTVCTAERDGMIIRETNFPLNKANYLIESISSYYSYSGKLTVYTHKDDFLCTSNFIAKDIYYGHYGLNETFAGSECLGSSYINLIAD